MAVQKKLQLNLRTVFEIQRNISIVSEMENKYERESLRKEDNSLT